MMKVMVLYLVNKSISSSAQYLTLQKHFSHPDLVIYLFPNPTHKTKTGTASRWETTNSNLPGPIKLSSQSTAGVKLCCTLLASEKRARMLDKNHLLSQATLF
jgi:hypothetical protein